MSAAQALVGRDAELRVLQRTIQAVDGGASRAVGIVGEPGIGKSRLLDELGRLAAARGHLVLAGRATELERDVPFGLWVDALDDHLAGDGAALLDGLAADQVADLAVALPAVARNAAERPAAVERHRVARAVRAALANLAASAPVTVLLDDVQWADPGAADVIALLLHRPPDGPVVLALAARAGRGRGGRCRRRPRARRPRLPAAGRSRAPHRASAQVPLPPSARPPGCV